MHLEIREEPFLKCNVRYEREYRRVNIYGCRKNQTEKTFPRVKVHGFSKFTDTSHLVVEASCVTKGEPYEPHIYRLICEKCFDGENCHHGENCLNDEYCADGKYYVRVNNLTMEAVFRNMTVFRITQKNSNAPCQHRKIKSSNIFRLKFTLYSIREGFENRIQLSKLIVSRPITDVRQIPKSIKIEEMCPVICSIKGGERAMIAISPTECSGSNTIIKIYEKKQTSQNVWESRGDDIRVHRKNSISFIVPRYTGTSQVNEPIMVWVQLIHTDFNLVSDSISFQYKPEQQCTIPSHQGSQRIEDELKIFAESYLEEITEEQNTVSSSSGNEDLQTRNETSQNIILPSKAPNSKWHNRSNDTVISENMQMTHDKMMACDTFGHTDFQNYAGDNNPSLITSSQMHGRFLNADILEKPTEHEVITSRNAFDATNCRLPSCSSILQSVSNCQKKRKWDEEAKCPFRQRGC